MTQELAIRSMIIAPKDKLLMQFDLSQAESWCSAYLANEVSMKHFLSSSDIHSETAAMAYNIPIDRTKPIKGQVPTQPRYLGKKANHQLTYRSSYLRLAQSINAESDKPPFITVSNSEAKKLYDAWHTIYNLKTWWGEIETQLSNNNRTLITPYGRERVFYQQWGDELFKEATAHVPQSTVSDHLNGAIQPELGIKGGLIEVWRQFKLHIKIINQSHDSFVAEVDKNSVNDIAPQIYKLIARPLVINGEEFTIPVDCEVGERLGELSKFKIEV